MNIIFFNTIITNIIIFTFGHFFVYFFFKEKLSKNNLPEVPLFGIIFLGFIAVIINFFFPINKLTGTIILIIGILFFIVILNSHRFLINKILKNLLISSFLSYILISFSNIYRPDGGLYHLPFISLINENKIILGSVNINFRYAITSIAQYISAIQNNYFFDLRSISIPIASIFSFSILFMAHEYKKSLKYKNDFNSLIFFLITCYSLIGFGRFSNYGNDSISHLFFFILIIFIIKDYKKLFFDIYKFNKVVILSIFLFTTKPFMLLILIVPLILLVFNKNIKEVFQNKTSYVFGFFLIIWVLRSILISGCAIYPLEQTCFKGLKFYDHKQTIVEANSGEAWAKDWINQEKKVGFIEYNKNFNWLKTWKQTHLKKIIEKITPFLIFLFILTIVLFYQDKKKLKKINQEVIFLSICSFILTIVWFLKFPLYRYGSSFIISLIIFIFIYVISFLKWIPENKKMYKNFQIFILICSFAFFSKNIIRINKNINDFNNKQWPDIYSDNNDYILREFKLTDGNKERLYYFSNGALCMYSKSPCSNYDINNLKKEIKFSYSIFWKN